MPATGAFHLTWSIPPGSQSERLIEPNENRWNIKLTRFNMVQYGSAPVDYRHGIDRSPLSAFICAEWASVLRPEKPSQSFVQSVNPQRYHNYHNKMLEFCSLKLMSSAAEEPRWCVMPCPRSKPQHWPQWNTAGVVLWITVENSVWRCQVVSLHNSAIVWHLHQKQWKTPCSALHRVFKSSNVRCVHRASREDQEMFCRAA